MSVDLIVQVVLGLVAIGSFMGQTRHALNVLEDRLAKLESLCYACDKRLAAIDLHLRGLNAEV